MAVDDEVGDDLEDDDAYLKRIAAAAVTASQAVAEADPGAEVPWERKRKHEGRSDGKGKKKKKQTNKSFEALFATLLDPVKRSDFRSKDFAEFVHPMMRNSVEVPKNVSKQFVRSRAAKFLDLVSTRKHRSHLGYIQQAD